MKKKLFLTSGLLMVALGVYSITPKATIPSNDSESEKVSFYSDTFHNVNSFPLLNGYNTWSIHNEETLSFMTNDLTGNYELLLSSQNNPEVYYQIIYHHNERSIKYFKYIGGEWSRERIVSRTPLMRVLWDVSKIKVDISENRFRIDIPWETIPELSNKKVLLQILSGSGDNKKWTSSNERHPTVENQFDTHLHDRTKWQRINFR